MSPKDRSDQGAFEKTKDKRQLLPSRSCLLFCEDVGYNRIRIAKKLIKFMIEIGKKYLAKVIFVTDGDTLLLEVNGEQFKSRARYIDCPETQKTHNINEFDLTIRDRVMTHWQWATTATNFLKSLVEGKEITIITIERDVFDRVICDWYLGKSIAQSKNIQLKLSQEGLCTHFLPLQQYNFPPRELNLILAIFKGAAIAHHKKIGFWKETDFLLPSDYKKLIKN
jgi:endonuclease YncB( thermonuclease family)